jgi:hypothetical protein
VTKREIAVKAVFGVQIPLSPLSTPSKLPASKNAARFLKIISFLVH